MANAARRNLHVPLQEDLYRRLREESKRSMRPATELAREALEAWLRERRKAAIHAEIAAYAAECAGSLADLDPVLEAAGLESLALPRKPGSRGRK